MTSRELYRDFYKKQIKHYTDSIEFYTDQIRWANEMLQYSRKDDRRLMEYVWSRGVVTEWEMSHYTKDYKGKYTRYYTKDRANSYKHRAKAKRRLKEAQEMLKQYV